MESGDLLAIDSLFFDRTIFNLNETKYIFYTILDSVNIIWWLVFMIVMFGIVFAMHIFIQKRDETI